MCVDAHKSVVQLKNADFEFDGRKLVILEMNSLKSVALKTYPRQQFMYKRRVRWNVY